MHGFDCLAHISDLSYYKIERPDEILEKDKTYDFVILRADAYLNLRCGNKDGIRSEFSCKSALYGFGYGYFELAAADYLLALLRELYSRKRELRRKKNCGSSWK